MTIEKLTKYKSPYVYKLSDLKHAFTESHTLSQNCILFITQGSNECVIDFALVQLYSQDTFKVIYYGSGTSNLTDPVGELRELRHMRFGEDGYVFHMPGKALIESMNILSKYFDL